MILSPSAVFVMLRFKVRVPAASAARKEFPNIEFSFGRPSEDQDVNIENLGNWTLQTCFQLSFA